MEQKNQYCSVCLGDINSLTEDTESLIFSLPFGDTEKSRLLSIKNPEAQKSSLCALLCLKEALAKRGMTEDVCDLTIIRDEGGKPHFSSLPLFFSISHSHSLCAVALCDDELGIDVEFVDSSRNVLAISKRFFSPQEHQSVIDSNSPAELFFSLWTKKEAIAKLIGTGLSSICSRDLPSEDDYSFKKYILDHKAQKAYLTICYKSRSQKTNIEILKYQTDVSLSEI